MGVLMNLYNRLRDIERLLNWLTPNFKDHTHDRLSSEKHKGTLGWGDGEVNVKGYDGDTVLHSNSSGETYLGAKGRGRVAEFGSDIKLYAMVNGEMIPVFSVSGGETQLITGNGMVSLDNIVSDIRDIKNELGI